MKKLQALFLILSMLVSVNGNAQFLDKLKKRAQEKIEREAEKRAQRRIDEKIDKTYDKAEETIDGKTKKANKNEEEEIGDKFNSKSKTNQDLPSGYTFDWKYKLAMETKDGEFTITYFLKPNAAYFGSKFEMDEKNAAGDMFMIMDMKKEVLVMLMDTSGMKMLNTTSMPADMADEAADVQNYTITKTDTKTILGYSCQGFRVETEEGVIHTYMAKDTPVSFNQVYNGMSKNKPKGFDAKWAKEFENGLMMEMDFVSKKKKKYNMKMRCIALEKEAFTIKLSEYKSFGF